MASEHTLPREFAEALTGSVWAAAAAVRWLAGRVHNAPKLHEATPSKQALTEADCVSQEILLCGLRERFPWIELDAEEDTPGVQVFAANRSEYRAIIDPIDGTLHYLDRDGVYAILVGLEQHGRVEASLVALPESDLLIRAVRGQGAEIAWSGGPFRPLVSPSGGRRLLISKSLRAESQDDLCKQGYELAAACGGAIGVAPLLPGTGGAVRISDQPDGLSRRTWVATLATLEAGGVVETLAGPFPTRYEPGIRGVLVAPNSSTLEELRQILG
jgi:fructose-1,6-bisphosphatase/inositol monophosphatase family enzyme